MLLFHSTTPASAVYFKEAVLQREDDVVYATLTPQTDYGPVVIAFEANLDEDESYDQGGYSTWTENCCVPFRAIRPESVRILIRRA